MGLYAGCADILKIESGDRSIGPGRLGQTHGEAEQYQGLPLGHGDSLFGRTPNSEVAAGEVLI